ncbi:hypothetical protein L916_13873 [Phytophthora nicotianae]|uniref:Uncharacterized protein n=1 Tax=Phytophthora nicotianae TaxID=4792 RepID=W2II44_PHYNI|nr:hypothetical protein L916_13873 [Phytophthora nicotianae]
MESIRIKLLALILEGMPRRHIGLLHLESGLRNKLSTAALRVRYHAGNHDQTRDQHLQDQGEDQGEDQGDGENAARATDLADDEVFGFTTHEAEQILRWQGRADDDADDNDFAGFVRQPPLDQERIEIEVETSWFDATGTPFRGDRSVYSEKNELFRPDANSDGIVG